MIVKRTNPLTRYVSCEHVRVGDDFTSFVKIIVPWQVIATFAIYAFIGVLLAWRG